MRPVLLVVVLAGYVAAFLPARRCHRDIGGLRRSLWVGYGSRDAWLRAVKVGYAGFGWPSLVVVVTWYRSRTRRALLELRNELREVQHEPERSGAPG